MIVKDIFINDIKVGENIRQILDDENIKDLMQTIKDNGLLQPIGVKETTKGSYMIIWGNRRLNACKKLGWKTISAVIFSEKDEDMSEEQFFVINAIENLQQKPNSLFELGRICKILRKTMSIGEIAVRLGIPKSRVDNALIEMSRIPPNWQKKIRIMGDGTQKKGDIPMITASKVARLRGLTNKDKNKLFKHISKNEETVQNVELIGSLMKSGKDFNQAVKATGKYRAIDIKVFVNRKKFDKVLVDYNNNIIDLVIDALNAKVPHLAFKNIRQN
jgi:ParB/RepB/Spo0J family partition protein